MSSSAFNSSQLNLDSPRMVSLSMWHRTCLMNHLKGREQPKKRSNQMSANEELKGEFIINDAFVELPQIFGPSMFIFAIDERGLPYFPERVKGKLPLYVEELAQKTIHHPLWCREMSGFGNCNCDYPTAERRLWKTGEKMKNEKLVCEGCKSSTEKIGWPRCYWASL